MSRPRSFDVEQATEQALKVFWRKGYEGTTLDDLTGALGINRPSLYAAFGSKEGLFHKAVDLYISGPGAGATAALEAPTAREVVERLWNFYADAAGQPDRPAGCLLVQGALTCGDETQSIRKALTEKRHFAEEALVTRLERAKKEGDLEKSQKPSDLARYVWTMCHGIAVQAVGGASREQLKRVVQIALRAWPA